MYGRGNYGQQFGQGLQRPMPPYQQPPAGAAHPQALNFQPGQPFPMHSVMQQGGPRHGVPQHGSGYLPGPPDPLNMAPRGPPGSGSNAGQSVLQRPLGHGGLLTQAPYPAGQQNFSSGAQNPHHVGLPPPPPPSGGLPRVQPPPPLPAYGGLPRVHPPPPPLQRPAGFGTPGSLPTFGIQQGIHHTSGPQPPPLPTQATSGFYPPSNFVSATQQPRVSLHMPSHPPPPPNLPPPMAPLPPSSSSPMNLHDESPKKSVDDTVPNQVIELELTGELKTDPHEGDGTSVSFEESSLKPSGLLELPPPPPKPADDKVIRNIEVLCQYISKNGPQFEEMVSKNKSGNQEFCFLFGGDPGSEASCAREYYLWMKKKCGLQNNMDRGLEQRDLPETHAGGEVSAEPSSFIDIGTAYSPADSDVDMEDDITQSDKEAGVHNMGEDSSSDPVSTGDVLEMQKQENTVQCTIDSSWALQPDKEPGVYNSSEDLRADPISTGDVSEIQKIENRLQCARDSGLPLQLTSPVKSAKRPEDCSGNSPGVDSPFRLIRNYASDDDSEDDDEQLLGKGKIKPVSPPHVSSTSCDGMSHDNMNLKCGTLFEPEIPQFVTACPESLPMNHDSQVFQESRGTLTKDSSLGKLEMSDRCGGAVLSNTDAARQGECASGSGADTVSCGVTGREDKKSKAAAPKIDEFGRFIQENASDSESDGSRHIRRRGRRDRSRSPSDRRRRRSPRRSPQRRKDRRSRSRSWSPKRRRSRSRSPHRCGGDFSGERQAKIATGQCFDFLKGRCYRGASCRFLHHDVDKKESSNRYKGRQYQGDVASARNSDEHDDMKGGIKPFHQDGSDMTSKIAIVKNKAEFNLDAVPILEPEDVKKFPTNECEGYTNGDQVQRDSEEPNSQLHKGDDYLLSTRSATVQPLIHHSSSDTHRRGEDEMLGSTETDTSAVHTSVVSPPRTSDREPCQGKATNESSGPSASNPSFSHQTSLPPSTLASLATNESKGQVDHNSLPASVSILPQSVPLQNVPGYHGPSSSQQSHYSIPPYPAWGIMPLPQPRPPPLMNPSLQYPQAILPSKNDFPGQTSLRAQPGEFRCPSQAGGFQYQPYQWSSGTVPGQTQFPSHGHTPAGSFGSGALSQPISFPGDTTVKSMQTYPGSSMLVAESSKPFLYNHQHQQPRLPPYSQPLTATDSMPSHIGGSLPVSGYTPESADKDHPPRFLDTGGSRISAHYNPYASTFDQPLSTRFSSTTLTQERENATGLKYDGSFSLTSGPMEGEAIGGHTLPRSGGDPYDLLSDSIEPSKRAQKLDHAADNSDLLKVSSHHKVLDLAENNKQKEVGAVVATTSFENDEYGETADAEVGAVENGSPTDPDDDDDDDIVAEGEIEIDQVKSGGKSKKSKDSRSMKLFKVAVANFVKDVLKPQWRQGNMSKEVFKTIVKKTVDKVSGAMKNHRLPKSQSKIDHYIDSSRRKLTQLVEGYVSKYKS